MQSYDLFDDLAIKIRCLRTILPRLARIPILLYRIELKELEFSAVAKKGKLLCLPALKDKELRSDNGQALTGCNISTSLSTFHLGVGNLEAAIPKASPQTAPSRFSVAVGVSARRW
jgi:hypothetical protein